MAARVLFPSLAMDMDVHMDAHMDAPNMNEEYIELLERIQSVHGCFALAVLQHGPAVNFLHWNFSLSAQQPYETFVSRLMHLPLRLCNMLLSWERTFVSARKNTQARAQEIAQKDDARASVYGELLLEYMSTLTALEQQDEQSLSALLVLLEVQILLGSDLAQPFFEYQVLDANFRQEWALAVNHVQASQLFALFTHHFGHFHFFQLYRAALAHTLQPPPAQVAMAA